MKQNPGEPSHITEATFFKEEIEKIIFSRYPNMSVYETIGALEVVKANLLDALAARTPPSKPNDNPA